MPTKVFGVAHRQRNSSPSLVHPKSIEVEFYQNRYVFFRNLLTEEKQLEFSVVGLLPVVKHLIGKLAEPSLCLDLGNSMEKLEWISEARRSFQLGLHLFPSHFPLLQAMELLILKHGPFNGQRNQILLKQLIYDESRLQFPIWFHFFKILLFEQLKTDKKASKSFHFIMNYFVPKYKLQFDKNHSSMILLNSFQLSEFLQIVEQFIKAEQYALALQILELATQLQPMDSSLYYSMYELQIKLQNPLQAFKCFVMYLYLSGSGLIQTSEEQQASPFVLEQYRIMAELLEQSKWYWHAFIAYYKLFKEGRDYNILYHIFTKVLPNVFELYFVDLKPSIYRELRRVKPTELKSSKL